MSKKTILVVEDNTNLLNSISTSLTKHGYFVYAASEFRDATFRLKNQKYDCLILYMHLSLSESGEDLIHLARNRKDSLNTQTPILVISGHLDKPLVQKIAGSIQGALVKPFELKQLLESVQGLTEANTSKEK